ncbi:unnamed protein product [Symbiodinium sp. CCMP2456]|nr:unnamed protein product [Symbiodinium sp. CCMP2456]
MDVTRSTTLRAVAFILGEDPGPGSEPESGLRLRDSAAQVRAAAAAGREADVAAAVFRLAQQSLVPPFSADSAEFAAAACAAVAGLSEPDLLGKEIGRSHILRVLEELARHVETFQPFVFSFLSRTGYGRIAGLDEVDRRMQAALSSSSVWLLAAFCRAVGCRCFSSEILWEWANGDPLFIGLLVRNTLTLEALSQLLPETPLQSLLIPPDLGALQTAVLQAFLGLTRPDIAFADVIPTRVEYHGTLEVPAPALQFARHWSRLAVATTETGLVPLLLTATEGAANETKMLLSAFLGRLLNATLQDPGVHEGAEELLQACHVAAAHLRDVLNHVCHVNRLWKILCDTLLATGLVRSFLRDCSELALATPGQNVAAFLRTAALQEDIDLAAMPVLCCIAANAHLVPSQVAEFTTRLLELDDKEQCIVARELEGWRGPVVSDTKAAWLALLRAVPAPPVGDAPPAPPPTPLQMPQRRVLAMGGLEELFVEAPANMSCALDGLLLTDPVISPHGHVFDHASLAAALAENGGLCPFTGNLLRVDMCIPDAELRSSCSRHIKSWARAMLRETASGCLDQKASKSDTLSE